jgi:hypothetical protein
MHVKLRPVHSQPRVGQYPCRGLACRHVLADLGIVGHEPLAGRGHGLGGIGRCVGTVGQGKQRGRFRVT